MNIQEKIEISDGLNLVHYNTIPVLQLKHALGEALISLQGAQLLQWRPAHQQKSVLWLSDIEPFELGKAIRGGIPLCYPWFNQQGGTPAHGYARIRLWHLTEYKITETEVNLTFILRDETGKDEAELVMIFNQDCELRFTHYRKDPAQLALHTYFNVSDISNVRLCDLPTIRYNFALKQDELLMPIQKVEDRIDAMYSVEAFSQASIFDQERQIQLIQQNASDMVLWNPGFKGASGMREGANRQMLCLETARIRQTLKAHETVSLKLRVK